MWDTLLLSTVSTTLPKELGSFYCKMNYLKKKTIVGAGLLLTLMLILAACGTSQQTTDPSLPSSTNQANQAHATLKHTPTGTSELKWSAASQTLTVTVKLIGLAPNSTHPAHIHKGDCNSDGATVFPLDPIKADATGVGTSETTITQDAKAIPESGWYINVHNGPDMTTDLQKASIACGNIANPNASTTSDQSVKVTLGATSAPNQSVSGDAELSLDGDKLTVKVTVTGLAPNSTHIAHIHKGSCEVQGDVKYPLTSIVADANGKGTSTTTIDKVTSIPATNWYVNVHLGAPASETSPQTGGDGITCGNVTFN